MMYKIKVFRNSIEVKENSFPTEAECISWKENFWADCTHTIEEIIPTYKEMRKEAYEKEGCSHAEIMDALIQKEFDNDSTAMGLINAKRILIKQRYPKL